MRKTTAKREGLFADCTRKDWVIFGFEMAGAVIAGGLVLGFLGFVVGVFKVAMRCLS